MVFVENFTTPTVIPDLTKPSAKAMVYILDHQETWPPGFEWNFMEVEFCAAGLVSKIWEPETPPGLWKTRRLLGLSIWQTLSVTCGGGIGGYGPSNLARKIEGYIK